MIIDIIIKIIRKLLEIFFIIAMIGGFLLVIFYLSIAEVKPDQKQLVDVVMMLLLANSMRK